MLIVFYSTVALVAIIARFAVRQRRLRRQQEAWIAMKRRDARRPDEQEEQWAQRVLRG